MLLAIFISQILITVVLVLFYWRQKRNFLNKVQEIQVPKGDGQLSELGEFTQAIGQAMGQSIVLSLKQTAYGQASGAARQEKAVDGAIVQDMIGLGNPVLGLLINQMPKLSKAINKNPELAAMAAQKLGGLMANKGKSNNEGVVTTEQLEDTFQI